MGQEVETAGVVGHADRVVDGLSAAGLDPVTGDLDAVLAADPPALVAVGERALVSLARRGVAVPVLPVAAGRGVRSVPLPSAERAGERLAAGDWGSEEHPVLGVDAPGTASRAFFDAMLVTAEPADISEYSVTSGGEQVARFRADGVVAATPAGSTDYTRAAGGPVVTPGLGVLAVVPVSPFATNLDHWVLPLDARLTVEREEAPVELLVDDRSAGSVPAGDAVTLEPAGRLAVVRVPEGVSPYGRDAELEKL